MIMSEKLQSYRRKVHEGSERQGENYVICAGSGKSIAASREGRQENGTGVSHPHLCVGEGEGGCEETVTLVPYATP